MKLYYPALFLKEDDGRYSVSFSDVPEAITCGNDFENAVEMAKECLKLCIKGRMEDK
ncbi:MAG: type II toxin-antitoxin system HicB family antitoxin [Bacillota bacterium]|nr:type II toxin-antitoxin system HicB family antitoxin [Bacillota bacterium]